MHNCKHIFVRWLSCIIILTLLGLSQACDKSQERGPLAKPVLVNVRANLERLIYEEDTDGDHKITIRDCPILKTERGDKRFWLSAQDGRRYEVAGTYFLANLLQELALAQEAGIEETKLDPKRIFEESPVARISRSIREINWDKLTRRIDLNNLNQILHDEKTANAGYRYVYVPYSDQAAYTYFARASEMFPALKVRVERLPARITPEYVRSLDGNHGLLVLAIKSSPNGDPVGVPFVVPGGRFNEMYGWDSYFIVLGLLADGRVDLARGMVDNLVYQIEHYGKILNANRTYYLTRSQPPFLTSMALAVYENLPPSIENKAWLKKVFAAAIKEYYWVWLDQAHLTETGLSRYYGCGLGQPPEVEPGHFDAIYRPFALARGLDVREFETSYYKGQIKSPELDRFFVNDRALRESGHDTTYRWDVGGDRGDSCADFVTVDLNSLLYKTEIDIGRTIKREFGGKLHLPDGSIETSKVWYDRAQKRKDLIQKYLWDEQRGLFFDYDLISRRRHEYVSATTFYPLWACHPEAPETRLATPEQAKKILAQALPLLEMPGGLAASAKKSRGTISETRPARQWDYPIGWAPHQMLAWQGMFNYGFNDTAHRLIYRWLYSITRTAVDYNGTVPEKLDVAKRSHQVSAEYGNVGTEFAYVSEGFGWMNASYQVGLKNLPAGLQQQLDRLVPPEWIFVN
jgi:alpha,alpha-trehalase